MKLIPLTSIHISPDRQRKAFDPDKMQELVEDIQENGLFNAIVLRVQTHEDAFTPDDFLLCQGERRLRAIQDIWDLGGTFRYDGEEIPVGQIPYVTLGDLSPLQAEIAELSENLCRAGLTWQEQAAATARIAQLRGEIAVSQGDSPPPVSIIAEEVRGSSAGIHQENTRREILLAPLMQKDPEIRAAKNLNDAWKLAKKKEATAKNIQLAESVGRTFSSASHTLLNEDSLPWLQSCPPERFDVILTDPPYGMGAESFGDSGGVIQPGKDHYYEDSYENWKEIMLIFCSESFRITKPFAHLYSFCDFDRFHEMKALLESAGWFVHRTPIVLGRPSNQRIPWAQPVIHGPQRKYELILYANKGRKPVTAVLPDLFSCPADTNVGGGPQKPVAAYVDLLKRSIRPGDQILDPFAGSGPLIPAAHELKCYATALEKDPSAFGLMVQRAKGLDAQRDIEELLT